MLLTEDHSMKAYWRNGVSHSDVIARYQGKQHESQHFIL